MVTICLGRRLPGDSSDRYPRARRAALSPEGTPSYLVLLRTGFAWPAGPPAAGGLLPHRFTLALRTSLETGPLGGLISVALSFGSPRLGVTQRPALWSPDFPPTLFTSPAVTRPPRPEVILPGRRVLLNLLVQCHVGELVGTLIVLALDVLDLRGFSKAAFKGLDLAVN